MRGLAHLNVNKIYVTHYSPLEDRRKRLSPFLEDIHSNVEWQEEELTKENLQEYYVCDEKIWNERISSIYPLARHPFRPLKRAEISIAFKHIRIFEKIIEDDFEDGKYVIFEDDIVPVLNFTKIFNEALSNSPKDWDVIFFGSGCDMHIAADPSEKRVKAYRKKHPASRCADSYIISKGAVKKIIKTFKPFTSAYDFELACHMYLHDLKVYWWEPSLTKQGSQCGMYESTIQ